MAIADRVEKAVHSWAQGAQPHQVHIDDVDAELEADEIGGLVPDYASDERVEQRAAAKAEKKLSAGASNQLLREESAADALHDSVPAVSAPEKAADAAGSQAEQQLRSELQRLLKLRRDGWTDEADALLLQLMREHPELDIDAQLQQLQSAE